MTILSADQIRQWDAYTIANEPIPSIDLMERASLKFTEWFTNKFTAQQPVHIFCGTGNNGGDGLAIGRLLLEQKYDVRLYAVRFSDKQSPDFNTNEKRLKKLKEIKNINNKEDFPVLHSQDLVIDAIFGSGLSRPITGFTGQLIDHINSSNATIISVDIASGLFCNTQSTSVHIIKPDHTVSFQTPKLSFMLPQNEVFTGNFTVVDIGLSPAFIRQTSTPYIYTDSSFINSIIKKRSKFSHKGTYGHTLLIGGSKGKVGAIQLCAKAALRTGLGLLTTYVPYCGFNIMQTTVPEAMCMTDPEFDLLSKAPVPLDKYQSVGIGPGIGTFMDTQQMMEDILENYDKPMVLDADALNILSQNKELLDQLPEGSILTPHPKEFERLLGDQTFEDDYERLELQIMFAKRYQVVVVLKGAHTSVATPLGRVYFNSTGNPGMATGGSGDVLTGVITALLSQGYAPGEAAILGVYLHGLAGDLAASEYGQEALIASDIINNIGKAYQHQHNS
ncbi:NAD(P)H-hydrate dehydratase [Limibacter armeniacum]|uniref:NAD(P)H-hydrate dehydratase n=1 Tax=Limibacter armeniacum TaxID=466084 RepID=UPI002FE5271E